VLLSVIHARTISQLHIVVLPIHATAVAKIKAISNQKTTWTLVKQIAVDKMPLSLAPTLVNNWNLHSKPKNEHECLCVAVET